MTPRSHRTRSLLAATASIGALLVACSDPGTAPGDRPDIDGCVQFFNEQAHAERSLEADAVVAGQSRWEWEGRQAVCWVTLFTTTTCVVWSAMEPDWQWASATLSDQDCGTMRHDITPNRRLLDGDLVPI